MRKGKYSGEQVIAILREHEAGRPTAEICRKYGVSNATFYKWKSKFGGMQVSDAKRLWSASRTLEILGGSSPPVRVSPASSYLQTRGYPCEP